MGKPFLTIEEQIELLERRGVSRTEGERCALMPKAITQSSTVTRSRSSSRL